MSYMGAPTAPTPPGWAPGTQELPSAAGAHSYHWVKWGNGHSSGAQAHPEAKDKGLQQ